MHHNPSKCTHRCYHSNGNVHPTILTWHLHFIISDPKRIVVAGSNNHDADGSTKTWITLCDSDQESGVDFPARSSDKLIVFNNDQEFKHHAKEMA